MLLSLAPIATASFIASYPYLWPDPIRRTLYLIQFRSVEMQNQGEIWQELDIDGPIDALGRIGHWLGDVDSVTGQGIDAVARLFGLSWKPMGLDLVLAVIGTEILLFLAIQHGLGSRWALAALVLGGEVALIVVGMRADFERYLYPVLISTTVCGGLVPGVLWDATWSGLERRIGRRVAPRTAPLAGEPAAP
jgi:hypothetical protein